MKKFYLVLIACLSLSHQVKSQTFAVQCGKENVFFKILKGEENAVGVIRKPDNSNYKKDIVLPSTVSYSGKEYTVTRICGSAFTPLDKKGRVSSYEKTGKVSLPSTIKVIEPLAFYYYNNRELVLPSGIEEIGDSAFFDIGEFGVTKYHGPFEETFVLPQNLKTIGEGAFAGCTMLRTKKIVFPESLRTIGNQAFSMGKNGLNKGCLTEIVFNEGLENIGSRAFAGNKLQTISLPSSIKSIGKDAFICIDAVFGVGLVEKKLTCQVTNLPSWVDGNVASDIGLDKRVVCDFLGIEYALMSEQNDVVSTSVQNASGVKPLSEEMVNEAPRNDFYKVVNTSLLNVRASNTTSSQRLGTLKADEIVPVLEIVGNWARIDYNGKKAFVSLTYLDKVEEKVSATPKVESIVQDNVTVGGVPLANEVTQAKTDSVNVDRNKSYKSFNIGVITGFRKDDAVMTLSVEYAGYNKGYLEVGMMTNFKKSWPFALHLGLGYSVGIYKNANSCISLIVPALFHMRVSRVHDGYNNKGEAEYKTKVFGDFSFTPKVKAKFGTIVLSAGYDLYLGEFKSNNLSHAAIFSIGYTFQ